MIVIIQIDTGVLLIADVERSGSGVGLRILD